eukprot:m.152245 g.152245  ORF g.152245 m.152245 type:complete len:314 (-) comp9774_c0_seq14:964-1905(-)
MWHRRQKKEAYNTDHSRVVSHHSTTSAQRRLTAESGRDPVHSPWYDRRRRRVARVCLCIMRDRQSLDRLCRHLAGATSTEDVLHHADVVGVRRKVECSVAAGILVAQPRTPRPQQLGRLQRAAPAHRKMQRSAAHGNGAGVHVCAAVKQSLHHRDAVEDCGEHQRRTLIPTFRGHWFVVDLLWCIKVQLPAHIQPYSGPGIDRAAACMQQPDHLRRPAGRSAQREMHRRPVVQINRGKGVRDCWAGFREKSQHHVRAKQAGSLLPGSDECARYRVAAGDARGIGLGDGGEGGSHCEQGLTSTYVTRHDCISQQ